MMIWHMEAPTLGQIVRRSRADVDAARAASLHYWASQNVSLQAMAECRRKRMLHVHPNMGPKLLRRGFLEREIKWVSFGVDPEPFGNSPPPAPRYDVVWIGRVHRQKGIDDLIATLKRLSQRLPGFKAVVIGKVQAELAPMIAEAGLESFVDFPGFVSEEQKFELFRASRLFLMPSRFEGSPRVIGEALVCGLPVVAYRVETYPAVYGDFIRCVDCFDAEAFAAEAENLIRERRAGRNYLDDLDLAAFKKANSWETTQETFLQALREIG
jgi:glycosyltransferase involved in cell wall biosynthesis